MKKNNRIILKRFFLIIIIILSGLLAKGQMKYFVGFADKNGTPYTINNPSEFLSQKSIERRNRQNINVIERDLPVSPIYILQIKVDGVKILYPLKWFNGVVIEIQNPEVVEAIRNLSFVEDVRLIYSPTSKASAMGELDIYSAYRGKKSGTDHYDYGYSANQTKMLNGHFMHNKGFRGKNITIGVLDAGFYKVNSLPAFDSLNFYNRLICTKDFVNPNSNIYNEHTHGMLVLSAMAGNITGSLIGTAPEANYVLIRTEDANSEQIIEEYNWAAGAEFADSIGVDVINSSLGYYDYDIPSQSHSYSKMDGKSTPSAIAANFAASTGMLIVASAGNEGTNSWRYIITPSDSPGCLAIGAVDGNGSYVNFSSIGPSADGRVKPDIVAQGYRTVVQSPNGEIGTANGTSLSAPVISGLAACLWQALPNLTAKELAEQIIASSSQFTNPDNQKGYGQPNFLAAMENFDPKPQGDNLLLFPNPTKQRINLLLPSPTPNKFTVVVTSTTGRVLLKEESTTTSLVHSLNLPENSPTGVYLVQLITENQKNVGKIIKL